jgi:hypothetical protein
MPAAPPAEVAPPAAVAPIYPAPPPYGPGYAAPYVLYPAPGAGAPRAFWTGAPPVTERRSDGMRITGIVLFAAGGVATVAGATIFGIGANCVTEVFAPTSRAAPAPAPEAARGQERLGSARQALNTCNLTTPGIGILIGGVVTAIVGIPLFVIGSRQKPAQPAVGALVPSVGIGAGNATLRWTF